MAIDLVEARQVLFARLVGGVLDTIYHSRYPIELGGRAHVYTFEVGPQHIVHVTAGLHDPENPSCRVELMMSRTARDAPVAELLANLSQYLWQGNDIDEGHSFGDPSQPIAGTSCAGVVAAQPDWLADDCVLLGRPFRMFELFAVTADELAWLRATDDRLGGLRGARAMIAVLRRCGLAPVSELMRESLLQDPRWEQVLDDAATASG